MSIHDETWDRPICDFCKLEIPYGEKEKHRSGICKGTLNDIKKKRIAIVGSRNYNNRSEIYKYLDSKLDRIGHLVSGGCPTGADNIAQQYAKDRGLSITIHYPNWERDKKGAGFIRNRRIVEDCDILIAWQANNSKGTQNSIDLAKKLGKKVIIHEVNPDEKYFVKTTPLNMDDDCEPKDFLQEDIELSKETLDLIEKQHIHKEKSKNANFGVYQ